ncbi:DUF6616 family protein [Klebsiella sp. PL-2018]|uniref:DUF6616 family protein n=1 Tax=Klebsiella sp. PL-2018 TaxID=2851540 RepID=UPI001C2390FB|nr:DUF6616 family protein [Klebsiella sp. PL-2018]QXD01357.1 hypothetical protein MKleb_5856 [Klebsiella sp. PL-2018]HCT7898548.1 hypothetical protein [Enterobacter cloacae]
MSCYLVELYTPNAEWKSLTIGLRRQFLEDINNSMSSLSSMGVEILTLTEIQPGIDRSTEHRFLGIWRFPDAQTRDALLAGIKASGWYEYFEHVNVTGTDGDFAQHLRMLENA